jgi:AraC family transcriptional regulator
MTCNDVDFAKMIKNVWSYIFNQWFESVDFEYDESREAFEYYDERCHYRKDAVMDIYIPIK